MTSAKGRGAPGAGGVAPGAGGLAAVGVLGAPGAVGVTDGVAGGDADGIAEAAGAGVALRASLAPGCIVAHADSIAASNDAPKTMPKRDAPCTR